MSCASSSQVGLPASSTRRSYDASMCGGKTLAHAVWSLDPKRIESAISREADVLTSLRSTGRRCRSVSNSTQIRLLWSY
jgi:hypothetical protein